MQTIIDSRGIIDILDNLEMPFIPCRLFVVHDVETGTIRGQHGHKRCQQLLICWNGSIEISTPDTVLILQKGDTFFLDKRVVSQQKYLTPDAVLLVLCSHHYDAEDYVYEKWICRSVI